MNRARRKKSMGEQISAQFKANGKKNVIALVLIGLMCVMWIKVLFGGSPEQAMGVENGKKISGVAQQDNRRQAEYCELEVIEGRNDVINRNYFSGDDWKKRLSRPEGNSFISDIDGKSTDKKIEVIKALSGQMKLDAISLSGNLQVFINDKLLETGGKFEVKNESKTYEFQVMKIEENSVTINYEETEIVLKFEEAQGQ